MIGGNGAGKTSLLEAIYYLATATSPRVHLGRELIHRGASSAFLELAYDQQDSSHTLSAGFSEKERRFRWDGQPLGRASDLYGIIKAVFFSPEDLEFLSGGPTVRRRLLDLGLCQKDPPMVRLLLDYRKALKQRNALLKTATPVAGLRPLIHPWDREVARLGSRIVARRGRYALDLLKSAGRHYAELTDSAESLTGTYRSAGTRETWRLAEEVPGEEQIEQALIENLEAGLDRDVNLKQTHAGPHRDDFHLDISSLSAERFASQGQRRSAVLALKLAESDLLLDGEEKPVLLVDDVTHEMDAGRCQRFLEKITTLGQAFLTFTETESVRGLPGGAHIWRVAAGNYSLDSD